MKTPASTFLMGIGGAPEGVITAAALKCLGGDFQGRLCPEEDSEIQRCHEMGITQVDRLLTLDELVASDDVIFVATGITDSFLLKGVRYNKRRAVTRPWLCAVLPGPSGTSKPRIIWIRSLCFVTIVLNCS